MPLPSAAMFSLFIRFVKQKRDGQILKVYFTKIVRTEQASELLPKVVDQVRQ
jgi:hypothetical protein